MAGDGAAADAGRGPRTEFRELVPARVPLDLGVLARVVGLAARWHEADGAGPQSQRPPGHSARDRPRAGVAERLQQCVVQQREAGAAHQRRQRSGIPGSHQPQGGVGDPACPWVPAEVFVLVGVEGALEVLVALRQVLDPHPGAERAVVGGEGAQFVAAEASPAEIVQPAFRGDDEGAQDVAHVVVADVVAAVHLVDAADGRAAFLGVEAVLHQRI